MDNHGDWESCDDCRPNVAIVEITNYERGYCPKCLTLHAWDDEEARWFALDEKYDPTEKPQ